MDNVLLPTTSPSDARCGALVQEWQNDFLRGLFYVE